MERISVWELQEHWRAVDNLVGDETVMAIHQWRMPPWNDICSQLDWRLHRADGGYFAAKHHGYYGVYRLIGLSSEGDLRKPATFNRICGQDTTGTLYIGQATSLHTRLNQLRRSLNPRGEDSHNAARMLRLVSALDFPPNKLAIALLFTGRTTRSVERDLIKAYLNSFGDAPPLNYRL